MEAMIPKENFSGKFYRCPQIGAGVKNEAEKRGTRVPYQSSSPTVKADKVKSYEKNKHTEPAPKPVKTVNKSPTAGPHKLFEKKSSPFRQKTQAPKFDTKRESIKPEREDIGPKSSSSPSKPQCFLFSEKGKKPQKITLLKLSEGVSKPMPLVILDKIAEHHHTTIYRCIHPETGYLCCLKKCRVTEKNLHLLLNEHKIGIHLSHPNLVRSYCTLYDNSNLYILMEYMEGGVLLPQEIIREKTRRDAQAFREKNPGSPMGNARHTLSSLRQTPLQLSTPNSFAREILHQLLQGLQFIHSQKVCHRDIKPENIFISHDTFKIGDFGSACLPGAQESIGTLDYAAPEILLKLPYSNSIDMWSLGCVAYELDVGKPPFYHEDRTETMRRITSVEYDPEQVKDILLRHLIMHLLVKDGRKRLTAQQALSHAFFDQLDYALIGD